MTTRRARLLVSIALVGVGAAGLAAPPAHAASETPTVVQLTLTGTVDPFVADYLTANIERAQDEGAAAVLLVIDTPGGLGSSMAEISQGILAARVPVIGYVSPSGARAASAGAIVLLSCPVAAMAPGTHVGAATPVGLNGGDLSNKITEDAASNARSLAETYDRNVEVAEAFVTEGLSITAEEALEQGIVEYVEPSRDALLATLDGQTVRLGDGTSTVLELEGASVTERAPDGFTAFLHSLIDPSLAFLFFWLGLILLVLELIVPGHIFSGTIGTILLLLSLFSFGVLPVRWIGILLLLASVVCFVIELKAPGLGAWGIAGLVFLLLGGWFLYDRAGGVQVSPWVLVGVATLVAVFFGLVVSKAMAIRRMPPAQGAEAIIGKEGVAIARGVSPRGGIVRVAAEEWQAVALEELAAGTPIRVTKLDGLVLTVERASEHAPAVPPASERS